MDVKFHDNIVTHVPICCLIDDYWMLQSALNHLDVGDLMEAKADIACVMECLAETIDRYTKVPEGLDITPSVFAPIAMCVENGVIMDGNKELHCRAGERLSEVCCTSACENCLHRLSDEEDCDCDPEHGVIALENGVVYDATGDGAAFVSALREKKEATECC